MSRLGELLLRDQIISPEQLQRAQEESKKSGERLGNTLIKVGAIQEDDLTQFLSKQYGVPAINLSEFEIERDVIERALTLDFIKEARNLILIGQNGLGKSMIAKNICHAAVLAGHSVLFRSASALIEDLQCESATARRRKLRIYGNAGLVCIDEVGYLSYDDNAADLLYEVVNRRYEHRSLIVTTNRGFTEWNEVFPNASCIVTLVDRLTHHADVSRIEGKSYRLRESELEAAARRSKK